MSTFGEKQLLKFGWKKGEGVGKEKGIKKPIGVEIKNNLKGIGAEEDFNNEWWDINYNKTQQSINIIIDGKAVDRITSMNSSSMNSNYSSNISDKDLFKACGKRSARKGARGLHHSKKSKNGEKV